MPNIKPMDFDRQLRSMLEDAEVKPSRRVWKVVSSRLDAAAREAADSWAWVKWAGLGLATAAALVAGIFILDPIPTYKNIIQTGEPSSLTAQSEMTAQPNEQAAAVMAQPAPKAEKTKPEAPVQIVKTPKAELTAQVVEPEVVEEVSVVETEPVTEPAAEVAAAAPAEEQTEVNQETYEDPFARMAWEDEHADQSNPGQAYISGSLIGNESSISSNRSGARYAPGSGVPKTGVSELGESSYGIPFTVGLGVRFYVLPRLSLGTGIDYSMITRSFEGKYNNVNGGIIEQTATGTFIHSMHYIGIPVNLYYDIVAGDKLKFYVYGGGATEYCIANKYKLYSENITYTDPVNRLQWSVGAGLGVEFKLNRFLGIYLDPGAKYYFDCQQPKSVRTEHPLLINFDAGLRFDF